MPQHAASAVRPRCLVCNREVRSAVELHAELGELEITVAAATRISADGCPEHVALAALSLEVVRHRLSTLRGEAAGLHFACLIVRRGRVAGA